MSSAAVTRQSVLHGRAAEEAAVRLLLDRARQGAGGALALLGSPGIGKTAVLDLAGTLAGDFAVLRVRGIRQETHLPLSGLHALLHPVAGLIRSHVLTWALRLGRSDGGVALPAALLEFLRELAGPEPVLVCVDDLHLLDAASREALTFAARRVAGERIALLFTAWDAAGPPGELPGDVPVRTLEPLDQAATRALAAELLPGNLSDDLRGSLERLSRGNPLALRELVESLSAEQLAGLAPAPDSLPVHGRLHRAHADRLAGLPEDTRFLLLLLAADPGLDTATLILAAEPADPLSLLAPAENAGVIRAEGERYVYTDETVRAVAYAEAPLARRRAAHRLLGDLLDGQSRRLARAWHRAVALDGPPERLAAELAAAASTATRHGHPGPSLAYERAARLTGHDASRAEWLAAAARHAWVSGDFPRARSLLSWLRRPVASDSSRGQAELMYGRLELLSGNADSARDKLLAAAGWLVEHDRLVGVKALLQAAEASYLAGDIRALHAIAGQAAVLRRGDDCVTAQLMFEYLEGIAATFSGRHRAAAGPLRRVVELASAVSSPVTLVWACVASLLLGEDATAIELSARAVDTARRRGAVSVVPQLLESMIQAQFWLGRYSSVAAHATEGLRLAQESGQLNAAAQHLAWLAHAAAVQGDAESCRDRAHAAIELAESHGLGIATTLGNWALAHLDLSIGRPAEAAARLRGRHGNDHVVIRVMASPHFIEAATRTGDRRRAAAALRVLERWAASTGSPDRLALVARCRALLAAPGEAGELFCEALELHRQGACRFETARTQLLYGGALRRERRPGAAREHLHGALETFERLGAVLWSERARAELRASGEAVVHVSPAGDPERLLTAQQLRIARLVAEGATNREVAERLFLSPRTIDHHLRNVFVRLGVRSRVELARLLS
ncbi:LuxR C-terminal-related transcriptional regulator [Nonomuraea cavernae]|uniref:Helix-turn-helix transcriptional regulator n=1 Tax=Nonomuraea cavernae TaxID=2045107 RepID=A0A918DJ13_9ACTN|nr:LuxR family transcriptional regulator [Nonomuraea cavernae]MCA2186734.1 LuxR C-terminal-related transcriptional regulator [Nonomuraea cavernae]GGO67752.1 helix-turn-helix transcriptional regulator [Nonomuraea cavernae]